MSGRSGPDLATDRQPGAFRASVFEFRPYPGTPEWSRLTATGRYTTDQLLDYTAIDLTSHGVDESMRQRDEFSFSVGIQFGEPTIAEVRRHPGRSDPRAARSNREDRMRTTGRLVTIDGPGGAGKSTLTRLVVDRLTQVGLPAPATTEPSKGLAGRLARRHTAVFHGYALACLVTADRYHHLETEIQPALNSGTLVVCDRYVPSSHVLQILDGVDPDFVAQINAHATPPDLAVILTCNEAELRRPSTMPISSPGKSSRPSRR